MKSAELLPLKVNQYTLIQLSKFLCVDRQIKVYGYTFRGSNPAIFISVSLFTNGRHLQERICSSGSKFFPVRVDLIFYGLRQSVKQNIVTKVIPLYKRGGKPWKCIQLHIKRYNLA